MSTTAVPSTTRSGGGVRGWVGLGLVLLVATVLLTLANLGDAGSTEALHPENPGERGTRAVARVLEQQGVPVQVVGSDAALRRAEVDSATTLVVTATDELGSTTYPALRAASDRAGTTVLVAPPDAVLAALDVPGRSGQPVGGDLSAECDLPLLAGLDVEAGGTPYEPTDPDDGVACFKAGSGAELPGLVATVGDTVLVGGLGLLTNDTVDEADNAAVALRLLGQRSRVVWYHASDADLRPGDDRADADSLDQVLPSWLGPALLLLAASVLITLLWQGRRFGPLVVEPLPVVVRADETEASRGRLYRAARARQHAADALRADARSTWRSRLQLPPTAGLESLCDHLARRPGAPDRATLLDLLGDGPVVDDRALLRLATGLAELDDPHPGPPTTAREDRP